MLRAALIFSLIAGVILMIMQSMFDPQWRVPDGDEQHRAWWSTTVANSQRNDHLIRECGGDYVCADRRRDNLDRVAIEYLMEHRPHPGFREIEDACRERMSDLNSGGWRGWTFIWERQYDLIDEVECVKERHAD